MGYRTLNLFITFYQYSLPRLAFVASTFAIIIVGLLDNMPSSYIVPLFSPVLQYAVMRVFCYTAEPSHFTFAFPTNITFPIAFCRLTIQRPTITPIPRYLALTKCNPNTLSLHRFFLLTTRKTMQRHLFQNFPLIALKPHPITTSPLSRFAFAKPT